MGKIVPFGKYKDQPVETMIADRGYCEWLAAQPWFAERFRDLYQVVINYGAEPQDTPAHNRLQAMFLDSDTCFRLAKLVAPEWFEFEAEAAAYLEEHEEWRSADERSEIPISYSYGFEVSGWDVCLRFRGGIIYGYKGSIEQRVFGPLSNAYITVECKPLIGDDYPSILRQIKRYPTFGGDHKIVLLVEVFDARGATFEQVKAIFASSGVRIVMLDEVDRPPWED